MDVCCAICPRGSGARPGFAWGEHGGTRPKLTDAYLLLGLIRPDYCLERRVTLYLATAQAATRRHSGPCRSARA
ncbi:hydantoinase/oxoprolinase family protein [Paraburkholderia ribeironis]